jgi:hypothetical protein
LHSATRVGWQADALPKRLGQFADRHRLPGPQQQPCEQHAKSGIERVTPVGCFPQGYGRFTIVASSGGSPNHPNWY